ncbi:hypothetical protein FA048_00070 [Pedobacter polaris]|uniref:Uncharacterized protein n=1 Tax=Pedobacter polaris TaxID=2571273 RepID=A0A4U1CV89_9SPHI|nr:hypothetical protein [Pedobacter polaris]TKC12050.1 hypothetical protein FA048_00070 [Pedobacter polaris]
MKNKKFTYLLLISVVALWGIIFYRVFNSMAAEDTPILSANTTKVAYFNMVNHEEDQVSLRLDYRNPFSENSQEIVHEIAKSPSIAIAAAPMHMNIKVPVKWNAIQYTGYINNPINKKKVAMLTLDGKEFMLTEGQQLHGVKLVKYATDSVKLQYQNEKKYIKLK